MNLSCNTTTDTRVVENGVDEYWIASEWIPQRSAQDMQTGMVDQVCAGNSILDQISRGLVLENTHVFAGAEPHECLMLAQIVSPRVPAHRCVVLSLYTCRCQCY